LENLIRYQRFPWRGHGKNWRERFRTLRSRLYQISTTQSLKKVLVTSSIPPRARPSWPRIWRIPLSGKMIAAFY